MKKLKRIYRLMSEEELIKVLNGEFIEDSRQWEHCQTTAKGVSFWPSFNNLQMSGVDAWNFLVREDDLSKKAQWTWNNIEILFICGVLSFTSRVSLDYLVEFEVSDDIYSKRVHDCLGKYYDVVLSECYVPNGYNSKEFKPVRVLCDVRKVANMDDIFVDYKINENQVDWIDVANIDFSEFWERYRDSYHADLDWYDEMEFLYA